MVLVAQRFGHGPRRLHDTEEAAPAPEVPEERISPAAFEAEAAEYTARAVREQVRLIRRCTVAQARVLVRDGEAASDSEDGEDLNDEGGFSVRAVVARSFRGCRSLRRRLAPPPPPLPRAELRSRVKHLCREMVRTNEYYYPVKRRPAPASAAGAAVLGLSRSPADRRRRHRLGRVPRALTARKAPRPADAARARRRRSAGAVLPSQQPLEFAPAPPAASTVPQAPPVVPPAPPVAAALPPRHRAPARRGAPAPPRRRAASVLSDIRAVGQGVLRPTDVPRTPGRTPLEPAAAVTNPHEYLIEALRQKFRQAAPPPTPGDGGNESDGSCCWA